MHRRDTNSFEQNTMSTNCTIHAVTKCHELQSW